MSTWLDVITDALIEINAYGPNDPLPPEDTQLAIRKLNRLLDEWSARKIYAYATAFSLFKLTPNHQPHLLGPGLASPDFAITARPVRIESAELVLTNQPLYVDLTVRVRDAAWWAEQRVKSLTSSVPTDLYYEPDSPNGALYLWPVPSFAYSLRLETWTVQTSVPLNAQGNPDPTQTFVAPQGYENAVLLTLAEELCTPYGRPMPAELPARAAKARATIQSNNSKSPRTQSVDYGTRGKSRGGFNWTSGLPT